jgi:hypothetical protein
MDAVVIPCSGGGIRNCPPFSIEISGILRARCENNAMENAACSAYYNMFLDAWKADQAGASTAFGSSRPA